MPERKLSLNLGGQTVAVTDVPIAKDDERPFEYELEDGSILRVKFSATSIVRVDGQVDVNGDPMYIVRNGTAVSVIKAGETAKQAVTAKQ